MFSEGKSYVDFYVVSINKNRWLLPSLHTPPAYFRTKLVMKWVVYKTLHSRRRMIQRAIMVSRIIMACAQTTRNISETSLSIGLLTASSNKDFLAHPYLITGS